MLAVCGIILFGYEDGFEAGNRKNSIVGVLLAVGSAVGAALYKVCQTKYHVYTVSADSSSGRGHCALFGRQ